MIDFLIKNNFRCDESEIESYVKLLMDDMADGLSKKETDKKNGQEMARTHRMPPQSNPKNENVIVIDAGGTNFRSCLVKFDENGNADILNVVKTKMPGVEKELSKAEFFNQIADNIEYLKNSANKIAFCFSYCMRNLPNGDGQLVSFAKEVKAPEVVGCHIGKSLTDVLESRGWNKIEKIILLNDTVAALNVAALFDFEKKYSSYIGFILGTGMNVAYVEDDQVVVCESGKCPSLPMSNLDLEFQKLTSTPDMYKLEKMCSGGYLPGLILTALKKSAINQSIEKEYVEKFSKMEFENFSMKDVDDFLIEAEMKYGKDFSCNKKSDIDGNAAKIVDAFINRSAMYCAAVVGGAILRNFGITIDENIIEKKSIIENKKPVAILCNGTTFYKAYYLRQRFEKYLSLILNKRNISFDILQIEDDITLGTAASVF